MADLEITLKKINTKLQMLQITRNECPQILQRSKIRELEKHLQMFEERLEKVHELKGKIQELNRNLGRGGGVLLLPTPLPSPSYSPLPHPVGFPLTTQKRLKL